MQFLKTHEAPVCYVSSDPNDPGLHIDDAKLNGFLTDRGWVRDWFFQNVATDVFVTTTPDLGNYQLKRSRHDVHYVYVHHSLVSQHMAYRPAAFDNFDTIFCAGPHHMVETRQQEMRSNLPPKQLVEHGYGKLDDIITHRGEAEVARKDRIHVLLAPSWGPHGVIETMGEQVVEHLVAAGHQVTVRPHPQTVRLAPLTVDGLLQRFGDHKRFHLDLDPSSEKSLHRADVMISDWSGAALDFAFGLEKPVLFIDVPRKVNNPSYVELSSEPLEVTIREAVGTVLAVADVARVGRAVEDAICRRREDLVDVRTRSVFNVGTSAEVGAHALGEILARRAAEPRAP